MNDDKKNKLFGHIAVKLGYVKPEEIKNALFRQEADEIAGQKKHIGSYLFEDKLLTKEQISQILKIQKNFIEKLEISQTTDSIENIDQDSNSNEDNSTLNTPLKEAFHSESNCNPALSDTFANDSQAYDVEPKELSDHKPSLKQNSNINKLKICKFIDKRYVFAGTAFFVLLLAVYLIMFSSNTTGNVSTFLEAIENENIESVENFIASGKSLKSNNIGAKALLNASSNGNEKFADFLLRNGVDVNFKDKEGRFALFYAAESGHEKIVELLIKKGADINKKNNDGDTALIISSTFGYEKVVELLINKGANPKEKNNNECTALDMAKVGAGKPSFNRIIKLLEKSTCCCNDIFSAAWLGHQDEIKMFLENGVNVNSKDKSGKTALIHAASAGHEYIVSMLISEGADTTVKDTSGNIALDWAISNNKTQIAELLQKDENYLASIKIAEAETNFKDLDKLDEEISSSVQKVFDEAKVSIDEAKVPNDDIKVSPPPEPPERNQKKIDTKPVDSKVRDVIQKINRNMTNNITYKMDALFFDTSGQPIKEIKLIFAIKDSNHYKAADDDGDKVHYGEKHMIINNGEIAFEYNGDKRLINRIQPITLPEVISSNIDGEYSEEVFNENDMTYYIIASETKSKIEINFNYKEFILGSVETYDKNGTPQIKCYYSKREFPVHWQNPPRWHCRNMTDPRKPKENCPCKQWH